MKAIETPLLVVGGGVAGAVAAARARALGIDVTLAVNAPGATGNSSGAIDVIGPWPLQMADALSLLGELASDVGLQIAPFGSTFLVATVGGTLKRTAMVQQSQLLDLGSPQNRRIGVAEVSGVNFFAAQVAKTLQWALKAEKISHHVEPVPIEFATKNKPPISCLEMSQLLQDELKQDELVGAIGKSVANLDMLLLPPILPRKGALGLMQKIEGAGKIEVRELLATPPSVPGLRLADALRDGLSGRGVRIIDEKISTLTLPSPDQRERVFIIATGRFLGGGLVSQPKCCEAIFGLPVFDGDKPIEDGFIANYDIFSAGIRCDELQRPLNLRGEVAASNLFAAGSIIAGPASGAGYAAWSGFRAAEHAVNWLSSR